MIVVADTSPICYLILINSINILPELYGKIVIPQVVYQELMAKSAPEKVKNWIQNYPHWLSVENLNNISIDFELEQLDRGEKEAIVLAEKIKADLVILDDKIARNIAIKRGLKIIGLVGILYDAARIDLIDLPSKFNELQKTTFFVSPQLLATLLKKLEKYK